MKKEKIKLVTVKETRRLFYDALQNKDIDVMADYFETLYHYYTHRGRLLRIKNKKLQKKRL